MPLIWRLQFGPIARARGGDVMKHRPDARWNAGSTARRGVRQSLTRAGVQLGYAVTGALTSSLEALEERLQSEADAGPPDSGGTAQSRMRELLHRDRAATRRGRGASGSHAEEQAAYGYTGKQSGGTARGRMRELLNKDRAMIATLDDEPFSDLFEQSGTLSLPAAPIGAAAVAASQASMAPAPVAVAPQALIAPPPASMSVVPPAPVVPGPAASVVAALQAAVATLPRATLQTPAVAVMRAPVMVGIAGSARPGGPAPIATRPMSTPAVHAAPVAAPAIEAAPVAAVPAAPAPEAPVAPAYVAPVAVASAPAVEAAPVAQTAAPIAALEAPAPAVAAPAKPAKAMPVLRNQVPVGSAPVAAPAGDDADSPIRTRSMARLLALQGHRDRALSIYDELLIAEPDNADLRAEADRLRG